MKVLFVWKKIITFFTLRKCLIVAYSTKLQKKYIFLEMVEKEKE